MQPFSRSLRYHDHVGKSDGNDDYQPCIICGKPVNIDTNPKTVPWIHDHNGGGCAVTETEARALDPGADLGWWPIGSDCLRKHPELKPYVTVGAFAPGDNWTEPTTYIPGEGWAVV